MTRAKKAEVIEQLTSSFNELGSTIVVCDYKGLNVKELETVRNEVRKVEGKTRVVKNTLANIALKNAGKEGYELKDTNILIWGKDQLMISKTVAKFTKEYSSFQIKKAYIDGEFKDSESVIELSKLPGREELLGMLLSVWTAPLRGFVTGLDNLAKKKEEAA